MSRGRKTDGPGGADSTGRVRRPGAAGLFRGKTGKRHFSLGGPPAAYDLFAYLSEQDLLEKTLDGIVAMAHKDLVVYHVNRDSTAIRTRDKVVKRPDEKGRKPANLVIDWKDERAMKLVALFKDLPVKYQDVVFGMIELLRKVPD
jgi:hypothetical protein